MPKVYLMRTVSAEWLAACHVYSFAWCVPFETRGRNPRTVINGIFCNRMCDYLPNEAVYRCVFYWSSLVGRCRAILKSRAQIEHCIRFWHRSVVYHLSASNQDGVVLEWLSKNRHDYNNSLQDMISCVIYLIEVLGFWIYYGESSKCRV